VDTPWGLTGLVFDAMLLGDRWEVIRQVPLSIVDGAIILELDAEATGALVPNSHYWWYLNVVRLSGDVQRLLQGEVVVSP
jgi:hypothetical protein